jgi:hypothetical protein
MIIKIRFFDDDGKKLIKKITLTGASSDAKIGRMGEMEIIIHGWDEKAMEGK